MGDLGRGLIFMGLVLLIIGLVIMLAPKIPWLGRLPGDITIKRGRFTLYFPLVTCLIISVLLSILFAIFRR
ncbi:MAG: DUF2905 domain-containing protein [Deltaproteobacteria bacterium]|nr:DUF2905 domain-containing protein [Deltaproteobacteria bacterium]MBW1953348.1 DUF2905 domain-containing protein [Deltaproteobacteria bacterium]MBW1987322.1 DUF2905 domain-containing protein [Deltaproteobacteria bacterium]MBW2135067.1 DUF2905 domain-containing protein [Deltaproteobacteria bacterium]